MIIFAVYTKAGYWRKTTCTLQFNEHLNLTTATKKAKLFQTCTSVVEGQLQQSFTLAKFVQNVPQIRQEGHN